MFSKKKTFFSKFSFSTIVFEQCLKNKTFEMSRLASDRRNVLPPKQVSEMKSLKLTHYDLQQSLKKYQKCIPWKYNTKRKLDAVDLVPSPTKYYKYFIASYITYANEK